MFKECLIACTTVIALTGVAAGMAQADTVKDVSAFHRSGQTFVTWQEVPGGKDISYNVYRSDKPITAEGLDAAERVAAKIPAGSGTDVIASRATNELIIIAVKDTVGSDWWYQSALTQNNEVHPQGYVLHTLGKPLPLGTGLCVHTVSRTGDSYYAVTAVDASGKEERTIVPGANAVSESVQESAAVPDPIYERTITSEDGNNVRLYVNWSTKDMANRDGVAMKFKVQLGSGVSKSAASPLVVLLHGAGGPETLPVPFAENNFIVLALDDFMPGFPLPYDWWYGYNSNYPGGDLTNGVNTNYDERRLLYTIEWARREFNVDPNRVYLTGASMGGMGTLSFGLRHPEIFAAIYANVPHTSAGGKVSPHDSWFEAQWGTRAQAVKTNEGMSIWDRLNMTEYVRTHQDIPFVKTLNSRDDPAMPWVQIPPFIKAMDESRHGFISGWGIGGHNVPFEARPMTARRFSIFKLAKNVSFPAFSNSSLNDDPGNGDPNDGAPMGQMGGGFDWTILTDSPREWEAEIRIVADAKSEAVTDITPRRLQQFKLKPGVRYRYSNTDQTGTVLQSGEAIADKWGLVTLQTMKVNSQGNRIKISRI